MITLIFQNHYERLQVASDASPEDIKAGFRKMARKYHPDVAENKHSSHKSFLLIKEAYDNLIDAKLRRDYDQLLAASNRFKQKHQKVKTPPGQQAQSASAHPDQTSNRQKAGRSEGFSHQNKPFDSRRPNREDLDIHASLEISLEEAMHGGRQNITLEKDPGKHVDHAFKAVSIQIPPGSFADKVIRVPGCGYRDPLTRETGQLILTLEIARHERFRLLGNDLFTSVEIYPWHAALGAMVPISTLHGMASLKIPTGAQSWQSFRMEGQGIYDKDGRLGDLIVSIKILQPPAYTVQQADLWKALKAAYQKF